jgi:hypothetical protein
MHAAASRFARIAAGGAGGRDQILVALPSWTVARVA